MRRFTNKIFGIKPKIRFRGKSRSIIRHWKQIEDDSYYLGVFSKFLNCKVEDLEILSSEEVFKEVGPRESVSITGAVIGWCRYKNQYFVIKDLTYSKKPNFGGIKDLIDSQKRDLDFLSKVVFIDPNSKGPKFWVEPYFPYCLTRTAVGENLLAFAKKWRSSGVPYCLDLKYYPLRFETNAKPNFRYTSQDGNMMMVDKDFRNSFGDFERNTEILDNLPKLIFEAYIDKQAPADEDLLWSDEFIKELKTIQRKALIDRFNWSPDHNVYQLTKGGVGFDKKGCKFKQTSMIGRKWAFLKKCLDICKPKTLMDIGCNAGVIPYLTSQMGIDSLGLESYWGDGGALEWGEKLRIAHNRNYKLAYWDNSLFFLEALGRFDLIVMFSIVHHGVFKKHLPSEIVKKMKKISKYLCFEYIQHDNGREQKEKGETYRDFKRNIDKFADILLEERADWEYNNGKTLPSNRRMLLLRIKQNNTNP